MIKNFTSTSLYRRSAQSVSSLGRDERRAFYACMGGLGMDGMDNAFFGLVIPALIATWGITRGEAGLVSTITLLSAAAGGLLAGALSDRYGRVRVLQWSIAWFSIFSLASAFSQDMTQLTIWRAVYAIGFGGEIAVSIALVSEISQAQHRATLLGVMHSMFSIGAAVATMMFAIVFSIFEPGIAWRVLFVIGVFPAALIFYIRRYVPEIGAARSGYLKQERSSALDIFRHGRWTSSLLGATISFGNLAGVVGVQLWLPTFLSHERGLSVLDTTTSVVLFQVSHFLGYLVGGHYADKIGRRITFHLSAICSFLSVIGYTLLPLGYWGMVLLAIPMGFFTATIYGGMGAMFAELFPTAIRGSGVAFCYNFGRALAAFSPTVVGMASQAMPLGVAIATFAGGAYGLVIIGALLVPETKGTDIYKT